VGRIHLFIGVFVPREVVYAGCIAKSEHDALGSIGLISTLAVLCIGGESAWLRIPLGRNRSQDYPGAGENESYDSVLALGQIDVEKNCGRTAPFPCNRRRRI
jgi:hypothetical protein